jgi:hypothetical protein
MAFAHSALDLGDRRVDRRERNDALRDEAGARRSPLVDQEVVVRLHAGELERRIFETPEGLTGASRHRRVENGVIHAIDVHCGEALARLVRNGGHVLPPLRLSRAIGHGRAGECDAGQIDRLPVDDPTLGSVGLPLDVRNAIAELRLRHALRPDLRVLLHVIVSTDESKLQSHVAAPRQGRKCALRCRSRADRAPSAARPREFDRRTAVTPGTSTSSAGSPIPT